MLVLWRPGLRCARPLGTQHCHQHLYQFATADFGMDCMASIMTAVIASGLDNIDTWLASTSVVFAFIAFAIARSPLGSIMRSCFDTTYQLGFSRQAATVGLSSNTLAAVGPCVAARTADSVLGRSCAKSSMIPFLVIVRKPDGSAATSLRPGVGGAPLPRSLTDMPASGANAATYTKALTLGFPPACVMTAPAHE